VNKGIFDINPPSYTYAFGQTPMNNKILFQMPFGFSNTIQTQTPNPQPVSAYPMPLGLPALNKDDEMVFVIDTTFGAGGATSDFGIPLQGFFYVSIDWGDGQNVTVFNGMAASTDGVANGSGYYWAHVYANHGTYVVRIRGGYLTTYGPNNSFSNWNQKITKWISFGDNMGLTTIYTAGAYSSNGQFYNINELPAYLPTSVRGLQLGSCKSLSDGVNINDWDTSRVTDMSNCFWDSVFNSRIDRWDVSNVTSMAYMFWGYNSTNTFNQPIGDWNVGKVTSMRYMFYNTLFNQDISNWNVSSMNDMASMFAYSVFNKPIGSWNVSNVSNMAAMFYYSYAFNQDISSWNVGNVTNMSQMFAFNSGFNQPIATWNVGNVTDMFEMFKSQTGFNQPIGTWNVGKVTNMVSMFQYCFSFNQSLAGWNLAGLNAASSLDSFLYGTGISTANYDATLIAWNNNKLVAANGVANWRTDLRPYFGNSKYSTAAAAARAALVTYGWTITDGGPA